MFIRAVGSNTYDCKSALSLQWKSERSGWLLCYFAKACEHLKRDQSYKIWQDGYHAEIIETNWFIKQKVNYIYNNPVKDKIVTLPEDYYFSSARNYAGLENELDVVVLDLF